MKARNVYVGLCCLLYGACADALVEPTTAPHDVSPSTSEDLSVGTESLTAAPTALDPELMYAVEPKTGKVAREIPPAVLADVLAQLERRGMKRELEHVKSLYDVGSGRVRDGSRAARAEARLRALRKERAGQP